MPNYILKKNIATSFFPSSSPRKPVLCFLYPKPSNSPYVTCFHLQMLTYPVMHSEKANKDYLSVPLSHLKNIRITLTLPSIFKLYGYYSPVFTLATTSARPGIHIHRLLDRLRNPILAFPLGTPKEGQLLWFVCPLPINSTDTTD